MILTAYFRTYGEHVTASKRGLCRPRRSRSEQESHARRHTVGSDLNPTQKQILFAPQSNVTCKSMAQRHTPGCLYAYLTNCSPPIEYPVIAARSRRLIGYTCALAADLPKQGAKGRIKSSRNSTPSEPAGRQGQESLNWCCKELKHLASGEIATVLSEYGSERVLRL